MAESAEERPRGHEVLAAAGTVHGRQWAPWGALRYAVGVGVVLAVATTLADPRVGVAAASGAVNAGSVGLTSGLDRPRAVMATSVVVLAGAAFLGSVTAPTPVLALVTLAGLGALAGLLTAGGAAAGVVGVQAMVGFVTLGHFPLPPVRTVLLCLVVVAGGAAEILLGLVLRVDVAHRALRLLPPLRSRVAAPLDHRRRPAARLVRDTTRALVHPDARTRWHALRLSSCLVVAQLVALQLSGLRGYWVTLTVLNVLKADWVTTASRGLERWLGTVLGVLTIGLFAAIVRPSGVLLLVAVTVVVWAAFTVEPVHYGLYCLFIAGYVVLFLQVVQAAPADSAVYRALDTTIGAVLALTALTFVPPRPAGLRHPH
ncbi:hypothetical protein DQ238_11215 [Geodermatophilus sp. TF02-6]|uniref:FUSC family protein n=1 Tax=Geodermatophilus sp. TF02-6 TaxID=2250575 RepID=UPI000DE87627|nr:FUSC family protein [Geodermatophilus sp. TF02-6]RBY78944.1 hypothetical protein DQ238_11215 [Geodermatophilus sp. TF02-6]